MALLLTLALWTGDNTINYDSSTQLPHRVLVQV